ncbi:TetR/AcrR family transcriptional regulator [Streptomyces sp. NPDC060000]|uniref:TetR/AcrR family transcriptional regulator n=1 Tax=Streptomyces sp. NPDC060000 TaxID=3347031 RepID=UPI0036A3C995
MEIARAAAGLFVSRGLRATRAEDIAQAAGIAPRTFYRYFATKEEAVAPLYAAGAERWAEAVREAPAELTVPEALEHAVRHTLVPGRGVSAASWEWVRTLIRLAGTSPALGKVWAEVCHTSETTLMEVLAERATPVEPRGDDAASNPAVAVVSAAAPASGSDSTRGGDPVSGSVSTRGDDASSGSTPACGSPHAAGPSPGSGSASAPVAAPDNVASPYRRFIATVASAAVRVAVESWAATDSPPTGRRGPAELALRNLRALQGFTWEESPVEEA